MSNASRFESISLTNQAVLLGLADLDGDDETPVQTHEVRRHCKRQLSDVEEVVGTISEADVIRSLYRLEEAELVEEVPPAETSPTGKGRPAYALAVGREAVYDGVADELVDGARD